MASTKSKCEGRFRFASDNSGHDYVIPVGMEDEFYEWVESDNDGCSDFEQYRVEGGVTFADPRKRDGTPVCQQ